MLLFLFNNVFSQDTPRRVIFESPKISDLHAGDTISMRIYMDFTDCFASGTDKNLNYSINFDNASFSEPRIFLDNLWFSLNTASDTSNIYLQCFSEGVYDTIKMILTYAPFDLDSQYIFNFSIGTLKHSFNFLLKPGKLDRVRLGSIDYKVLGDTINVTQSRYSYGDNQYLFYLYGFDKFGNRTGYETGYWEVNGDLKLIQPNDQVSSRAIVECPKQGSGQLIVKTFKDSSVSDTFFIYSSPVGISPKTKIQRHESKKLYTYNLQGKLIEKTGKGVFLTNSKKKIGLGVAIKKN